MTLKITIRMKKQTYTPHQNKFGAGQAALNNYD